MLSPCLGDGFLRAGRRSLAYESLSCVFRELELLIALSFANVIAEAVLAQADCAAVALPVVCKVTGGWEGGGSSVTSLAL